MVSVTGIFGRTELDDVESVQPAEYLILSNLIDSDGGSQICLESINSEGINPYLNEKRLRDALNSLEKYDLIDREQKFFEESFSLNIDLNESELDSLEVSNDMAEVAEVVASIDGSERVRTSVISEQLSGLSAYNVGQELLNISLTVGMSEKEYEEKFNPVTGSKWNIKYLKENYGEKLEEINDYTLEPVTRTYKESNEYEKEEEEKTDLPINIDSCIKPEDVENILEKAAENDISIKQVNQMLTEHSNDTTYQLSRITYNGNGYWAPDATIPFEVDAESTTYELVILKGKPPLNIYKPVREVGQDI